MYAIVQQQLAIDLNCIVDDLNGAQDSIIFVEAADNPGRRPYRRGAQIFEMLTMGGAIVVSATPARLAYAKEQLAGKTRDEAFAMPFIRGLAISCLPDLGRLGHIAPPQGFSYETYGPDEIPALLELPGFSYALQRDDALAMAAIQGGTVAAIAGAGPQSAKLWGIGIDVLPAYRKQGLAAYLVNAMMLELLRREFVPIYNYDASNIASQNAAHRAGFQPAWVYSRRACFEGELAN